MAIRSTSWTRRQFFETLAASAAAFLLPRRMHGAVTPTARGFAFVGSADRLGPGGAIQAFEISGTPWRLAQTISAVRPAHLEPHPTLPMLYAVHDVALWEGLPRGAVSAFRIDGNGRLSLVNTRPLSLSGTHPRHAAISPDGRYLLVAAAHGGLYNLLPIAGDGSLEPPAAIRKEVGFFEDSVVKLAAPQQVLFHPDGQSALAVDSGQESIGVFGVNGESLSLQSRIRTHAGAGPSSLALSPSARWIYAQHSLDGSIAAHRLTDRGIEPPARTLVPRWPGPSCMAMHPVEEFLFTADARSLSMLNVDGQTGMASGGVSVRLQAPLRQACLCNGRGAFVWVGAVRPSFVAPV